MVDVLHFWSCVAVAGADDCWLWKKGRHRFGHGRYSIRRKNKGAHRVAWELTYGAIPDALCVLHKCDVPACCNPKHLFLGTMTDNMADRDAKKRQAFGERHGRAIIKETDVIDMRGAAVHFNQRELSEMYGISDSAVQFALNGRNWKHVR